MPTNFSPNSCLSAISFPFSSLKYTVTVPLISTGTVAVSSLPEVILSSTSSCDTVEFPKTVFIKLLPFLIN